MAKLKITKHNIYMHDMRRTPKYEWVVSKDGWTLQSYKTEKAAKNSRWLKKE